MIKFNAQQIVLGEVLLIFFATLPGFDHHAPHVGKVYQTH
jgi:hypothetical protein